MITRSFDPEIAKKFTEMLPRNEGMDWKAWLEDCRNVMYVAGDNVGLATYEYPGLCNVHWFFTTRGREALNLAKEMLTKLFEEEDYKVVRGLTPENIKGARWLARQVGLKSHGIVEFPDGPYELLIITKEEFINGRT